MRLKAKLFCPLGFSAGALIKMTGFGFHNTHVTASEFLKTWVAVTLAKAFFCFAAAVGAKNLAGKM